MYLIVILLWTSLEKGIKEQQRILSKTKTKNKLKYWQTSPQFYENHSIICKDADNSIIINLIWDFSNLFFNLLK